MDTPKSDSRIADNPTTTSLMGSIALASAAKAITGTMKRMGVKSEAVDGIYQSAAKVVQQSDILALPDHFNDAFGNEGWIATSSFAVDTMRRAVDCQREGRHEQAEREILDWFNEENINLFAITRSKRFDPTGRRWDQLREALDLTMEERYWAAVPLILIAADGFASDILKTSPFDKDADLSVFDSIVGHPTSLPSLIAKITTSVKKSTDEDMTLPLRHGILHGRSLGYANRVVCMKAWLLMIALVDWASDKSTEKERAQEHQANRAIDWAEMMKGLRKTREDRRAIEAYSPRTNDGPFDREMNPHLPESSIFKFLEGWQTENYGRMADCAVNVTQQTKRKIAGELREVGNLAKLRRYELRVVRQPTVALAEAVVYMEGVTPKGPVCGSFKVIAHRKTECGDLALPTDEGRWFVQQSCMVHLMQDRTIENNEFQA